MKGLNRPINKFRNRGAVLLLAMIFLLLLSIVAGTVLQTSMLEFQMAGNDQFREEAFQQAQAMASEIAEDLDNFPVTGGIGYKVCKVGCNGTNFLEVIDSAVPAEAHGASVDYYVKRQGPLFIESLPFRQSQSQASSSPAFDAAIFEIRVAVDGSSVKLGSASVVQGVAVRVASSGQ
jgi:hypothetical protein